MPAPLRIRPGIRRSFVIVLGLATAAAVLAAPGAAVSADPDRDDALARAARVNDMSERALRTLLAEDDTLRLGVGGRLLHVDPAPTAAPPPSLAPQPVAPLDQTFLLHSNPDADLTIYLDFDGAHIAGTWWNEPASVGGAGLPPGDHPAWDPAGDGAAFVGSERLQVQEVWRRVAEDYAPFDVDVTTQAPTSAELDQTSPADAQYGVRALISPSASAWNATCNGTCGGIAYLDVFEDDGAWDTDPADPAWVFPQALSNHPAFIAEATSHEVGHNLGLGHDGGSANPSYYSGHGVWGPIMGASYNRAVTQWSKGDYSGANNQQDDLAIIAGQLALRADEAGGATASSAAFTAGPHMITTRADVDVFSLGTCNGAVDLRADPAETGANLDIGLALLDAQGNVVDNSSNPPVADTGGGTASGLGAAVTTVVAPSTYFARVEGVGAGSPSTSYDDYGSLGAYRLSATGCAPTAPDNAPSAPQDVVATPDPTDPSVTLTWSAPADAGSSPVTGYRLTRSGSAGTVDVAADQRSHTFTGLAPGTAYTFTVAAVNAAGAGTAASADATTAASEVVPPDAVGDLAAAWNAPTREITLTWSAPASDGGAPVTDYEVIVDGTSWTLPAPTSGAVVPSVPPGAHTMGVRAINSAGPSPLATVDVMVPKYATRTTLTAPDRARKGTRPTVTARVAPVGVDGTVTGRVRFTVGGTTVTLRLQSGRASYRLPTLRATGRLRVTATYLGTADTATSTATQTILVVRR